MHLYKNGLFLFLIGLFTIIYVMYCWLIEGSFEGQHTKIVQHGFGGVWLPIEIEILNSWEIAFLNNFIFIL